MTEKIENYPGFDLNYIKTDKFRTIKMSVSFARPYRPEDRIMSMLLSRVLLESTKKYPTREDMGKEEEDNYNQDIDRSVGFWGENLELEFSTTFLDGKYIREGHNEKCIDFLFEIIYNPNVTKNAFEKNFFKVAKKNLKLKIQKLKEKPMSYAEKRASVAAGYDIIIEENMLEQLESVTPQVLYEYYLEIIKNDFLDISIIGNVDDDLLDYLKGKINDRVNGKYAELMCEKKVSYKEIEEESQNSQTNLVIIYKMHDLTKKERQIISSLYDNILGNSASSKLFLNVREKNSLCYSIRSGISITKNNLVIKAGINLKDLEKAKKIIFQQVKNIEMGKISKREISAAISMDIESLETVGDSQHRIMNIFIVDKYRDTYGLEETIKMTKKVEKEEIINFSKKLKLDTVYVLKGVADGKENNQ